MSLPRNAESEALWQQGLAILEEVVAKMHDRFDSRIPLDELRERGHAALSKVLEDYKPERGRFAKFCSKRLRWLVYDAVCRDGFLKRLRAEAITPARAATAEGLAALAPHRAPPRLSSRPPPAG